MFPNIYQSPMIPLYTFTNGESGEGLLPTTSAPEEACYVFGMEGRKERF
jgi:hypothetical protein